MGWIRGIWNYVRASWEGEDGRFSYRRATAFVSMYLVAKMVTAGIVNEFQERVVYALLGFFLLLCTIVTLDQLERFKNGKKE